MFRWFFKHLYFVTALALPVVLSLVTVRPAHADEADQVRAREALLRGEVRPLPEVLKKLDTLYRGDVLDVELEDEEYGDKTRLVYEIKMLTRDGNMLKLYFDAKTLALIDSYGHDIESAKRTDDDDD